MRGWSGRAGKILKLRKREWESGMTRNDFRIDHLARMRFTRHPQRVITSSATEFREPNESRPRPTLYVAKPQEATSQKR